ncbi:carboxylesterase-like protein 1 [Dinothrombium tinctorium]|uniref:Carboxylesterase-like protein 1 n=1 Tax=Dinothrombium tinctorium TaxID=1965070 RepID=A0A3S4RM17_9ACAR|nr:carboxylesterase-like protein 1 [Dinothrombium tinctorium]RWS17824.1 carboxylesterase-like protein 1 [Dinothrombium tinctorium]RWS17836.1 carboxylesterase-like protein 1 [Dinothrombium tinctorium]
MKANFLFIWLIYLSAFISLSHSQSVITNGVTFRGIKSKLNGIDVHQYLGVPFANPPVGSLRFQRPESIIAPSTLVRDATKYAPTCIQMRHLPETINPLLRFDHLNELHS